MSLIAPAPTPTPVYPPSIDIPGSTLPLIWGAVLLVLVVLIAVGWSSYQYSKHTGSS